MRERTTELGSELTLLEHTEVGSSAGGQRLASVRVSAATGSSQSGPNSLVPNPTNCHCASGKVVRSGVEVLDRLFQRLGREGTVGTSAGKGRCPTDISTVGRACGHSPRHSKK